MMRLESESEFLICGRRFVCNEKYKWRVSSQVAECKQAERASVARGGAGPDTTREHNESLRRPPIHALARTGAPESRASIEAL